MKHQKSRCTSSRALRRPGAWGRPALLPSCPRSQTRSLLRPGSASGGCRSIAEYWPNRHAVERRKMVPLLAEVIDAHGGLDRWRGKRMLSASFVNAGELLALKGIDENSRSRIIW